MPASRPTVQISSDSLCAQTAQSLPVKYKKITGEHVDGRRQVEHPRPPNENSAHPIQGIDLALKLHHQSGILGIIGCDQTSLIPIIQNINIVRVRDLRYTLHNVNHRHKNSPTLILIKFP
jgi:hypothetical protein